MSARSKKALVLAVLATPLFVSAAQGAQNWNNTGTDFNAAASWDAVPPPTGMTAQFPAAAFTQPNLTTSYNAYALSFPTANASYGYDLTATSPFTLTLTSVGTGTLVAIYGNNTTGTNTVDAPLVLGAAALTTQIITQAAGGTIILNGPISSTSTANLKMIGGGVVTLAGNNSHTGGTTLGGTDTLRIANDAALGTGTFTWLNGTTVDSINADHTTTNAVTIGVSGTGATVNFTGSNNLSFGTATVLATDTINNNSSSGKTLTFASLVNSRTTTAGVSILTFNGTAPIVFGGFTLSNVYTAPVTEIIQGSGSVKITGPIIDGNAFANGLTCGTSGSTGVVTLTGVSTFTGAAKVAGGKLLLGSGASLANTSNVSANNTGSVFGTALTSNGSVSIVGGLTMPQNTILDMTDGYVGTLNVTGPLSLGTTGTPDAGVQALKFELGSAKNNDLLVVTGAATLVGTNPVQISAIESSLGWDGGQTSQDYTLITAASGLNSANFSLLSPTLTLGSTVYNLSLTTSPDFTSEILTVSIPEPIGMSLLGMAGMGLLMRRRMRRA